MPGFEVGNTLWKQRKVKRPRQKKDHSLTVLGPSQEIDNWLEVIAMAKQQKDYKTLMKALEIINVIQRGKPAVQERQSKKDKKDDLSGLMRDVFQSKPSKSKPVTQSNQLDTEE